MAIQKATGQVIGDLEVHSANIAPNAVTPGKLHNDITMYDSAGIVSLVDSDYVLNRVQNNATVDDATALAIALG